MSPDTTRRPPTKSLLWICLQLGLLALVCMAGFSVFWVAMDWPIPDWDQPTAQTTTQTTSAPNCKRIGHEAPGAEEYLGYSKCFTGKGWSNHLAVCMDFACTNFDNPECQIWYLDRDSNGLGSSDIWSAAYSCTPLDKMGHVQNNDDQDEKPLF